MFFKGPNFEETQSTDSNGLAVGYVKREMTLFFDDDNSLLMGNCSALYGAE